MKESDALPVDHPKVVRRERGGRMWPKTERGDDDDGKEKEGEAGREKEGEGGRDRRESAALGKPSDSQIPFRRNSLR